MKCDNKYIQPDFSRCAVITIDMQNDFALPGAVAEIEGTNEIINRLKNILDTCRVIHIPVIHIIRLYHEDGSNADVCRRALIESGLSLVTPGSKGSDLVETLKGANSTHLDHAQLLKGDIQSIAKNEFVLYKPRWGAFYQTGLEQFLKKKKINTLIFTGCNFPNCPRTSIYEASERDFKIALVKDVVSGVYRKGIDEMRNIGVTVLSAGQLLRYLRSIPDRNHLLE